MQPFPSADRQNSSISQSLALLPRNSIAGLQRSATNNTTNTVLNTMDA